MSRPIHPTRRDEPLPRCAPTPRAAQTPSAVIVLSFESRPRYDTDPMPVNPMRLTAADSSPKTGPVAMEQVHSAWPQRPRLHLVVMGMPGLFTTREVAEMALATGRLYVHSALYWARQRGERWAKIGDIRFRRATPDEIAIGRAA